MNEYNDRVSWGIKAQRVEEKDGEPHDAARIKRVVGEAGRFVAVDRSRWIQPGTQRRKDIVINWI